MNRKSFLLIICFLLVVFTSSCSIKIYPSDSKKETEDITNSNFSQNSIFDYPQNNTDTISNYDFSQQNSSEYPQCILASNTFLPTRLVVDSKGFVWEWAEEVIVKRNNNALNLKKYSNIPQQMTELTNIVSVGIGFREVLPEDRLESNFYNNDKEYWSSFAIENDGSIWLWRYLNDNGTLSRTAPKKIDGLNNAKHAFFDFAWRPDLDYYGYYLHVVNNDGTVQIVEISLLAGGNFEVLSILNTELENVLSISFFYEHIAYLFNDGSIRKYNILTKTFTEIYSSSNIGEKAIDIFSSNSMVFAQTETGKIYGIHEELRIARDLEIQFPFVIRNDKMIRINCELGYIDTIGVYSYLYKNFPEIPNVIYARGNLVLDIEGNLFDMNIQFESESEDTMFIFSENIISIENIYEEIDAKYIYEYFPLKIDTYMNAELHISDYFGFGQ